MCHIWRLVTSGVHPEKVMVCALVLAGDTKLGGIVDMYEDGAAIQMGFGAVDTRPTWSLMKFSKDKCEALHLGRESTLQ